MGHNGDPLVELSVSLLRPGRPRSRKLGNNLPMLGHSLRSSVPGLQVSSAPGCPSSKGVRWGPPFFCENSHDLQTLLTYSKRTLLIEGDDR